jgi:hypothetical protein
MTSKKPTQVVKKAIVQANEEEPIESEEVEVIKRQPPKQPKSKHGNRKVYKPEELQEILSRNTYTPNMLYHFNGKTYVGQSDRTIQQVVVGETKSTYDTIKESMKAIFSDPHHLIKLGKAIKDGKSYVKYEHWLLDGKGKSALRTKDGTERPMTTDYLPEDANIFTQAK